MLHRIANRESNDRATATGPCDHMRPQLNTEHNKHVRQQPCNHQSGNACNNRNHYRTHDYGKRAFATVTTSGNRLPYCSTQQYRRQHCGY